VELTKGSVDVGIVVTDLAESERFYRDTLGLTHVDDLTPTPGTLIRRYAAGSTLVKLVSLDPPPTAANPPGGAYAALGIRYLTFYVTDVEHVVYRCLDAGFEVPQLPRESRPGVVVAKVADPDGNWLEFITRRPTDGARPDLGQAGELPENVSGIELCWGTVGRPSVSEYFSAAAAAGFEHVTVRPSWFLASVDQGEDPETLVRQARNLGLRVTTVDSLSSALPGAPDPDTVASPQQRALLRVTEDDCFRIATHFGAPNIQVTNFLGSGAERNEMLDAFGALADRARERGFHLLLEFIPRTGVPDLAAAVDIVQACGRENTRIMVDTWHLVRTGGTVDELRAVPPGLFGGMQVSDCPLPPEIMQVTQFPMGGDYVPGRGRLLPGEGHLPLGAIIDAVAANNPPMLVGVEVFNAGLRAMPPTAAAALARRSLLRLLSHAPEG